MVEEEPLLEFRVNTYDVIITEFICTTSEKKKKKIDF